MLAGSPPRGRGKAFTKSFEEHGFRITPAWAGKRTSSAKQVLTRRDHPRVGGEKAHRWHPAVRVRGSPPRGRGKVQCKDKANGLLGITPAWAGKSFGAQCLFQCRTGSPPRGRGKGILIQQVGAAQGITPAWAGKRLKRSHRSGIFISGPIPFHSVLHRPAGSGGSRAGRDGAPAGQPQNAGPA